MTSLDPNLVLRRAPDLGVRIGPGVSVRIRADGEEVDGGPHALAVLDAFARPVALSAALKGLEPRTTGMLDWMTLMQTVAQLYRAGVLVDEAAATEPARPAPRGVERVWAATPMHIKMLNDRVRTLAYLAAIREAVRPGDVVVDLGTGTGILAIGAARAGARHVYAIEAGDIATGAQAIFEANGLADRVTLVRGWSNRVSLPERADVLVSEIIGSDPLAESAPEFTSDAVARLLKPDARLVPTGIKVFGLPVTVPSAELRKRALAAETLRDWQSWYDVDFRPLERVTRDVPRAVRVKPQTARDWQVLAEPVLLADVDLKRPRPLMVDHTAAATATAAGVLNGVLVYFELELSPTRRLTTHPAHVDDANHWRTYVWLAAEPLPVQPGDRFLVTFRDRAPGGRDGVSVSRG